MECHGPCQQGRLPCPTPDACQRPEDSKQTSSLVIAIMLVLTIFIVLLVLA